LGQCKFLVPTSKSYREVLRWRRNEVREGNVTPRIHRRTGKKTRTVKLLWKSQLKEARLPDNMNLKPVQKCIMNLQTSLFLLFFCQRMKKVLGWSHSYHQNTGLSANSFVFFNGRSIKVVLLFNNVKKNRTWFIKVFF